MKTNASSLPDIGLTAIAPAIWGSTYLVTTEFLPHGYPLTVALLRALPAGLVLLLVVRQLPQGIWWMRSIVLGALNFSFFWAMLFVSAYRLPGGVAATVGAIQPLIVVALARLLIGTAIRPLAIVAGAVGMAGVGLLVLTPGAALDPIGIIAGLAGAVSMAFGTVLTRRWTPPVSSLTFTAWQLTAGGVLLLPIAVLLEPALPTPTLANVLGIAWLGLIGAAFTYLLWFRGLSKLEPAAVASLGFLSPLVATLLGWGVLGQNLTMVQIIGMAAVLVSVWMAQRTQMARRTTAPIAALPVRS
ncbi:EamA family transporter [Rhizobium giardinii]|uniref:Putative blue pigment (Indigoidine) exporter n=1 Tax=Rhizobium giardinii TaxID=56731 RepID=A0A7W8U677_9HYPH|nr:EamA family transporter [Rhizobium giardinii]MBB5533575.1 putative blue pigment (indigoidine) exporter [Rhizobium giardinii]